MKTRAIAKNITTVLSFMVLVIMFVACDNDQGMMHGGGLNGMSNWSGGQILIILIGIGFGFLVGFLVYRNKK